MLLRDTVLIQQPSLLSFPHLMNWLCGEKGLKIAESRHVHDRFWHYTATLVTLALVTILAVAFLAVMFFTKSDIPRKCFKEASSISGVVYTLYRGHVWSTPSRKFL